MENAYKNTAYLIRLEFSDEKRHILGEHGRGRGWSSLEKMGVTCHNT